jgi:predicted RNA-binding protein with PIN domain
MCSRQEQVFESRREVTGYHAVMPPADPPAFSIDDRHLRSALELAVLMAREGRKFKPPMKYPKALDKYIKMARIAGKSLPAIRRTVEADEVFRTRIAAGALPELVDPIGKLWLERPADWEAQLRELVAQAEAEDEAIEAANELKKAERRRDAAETAAARVRAELVVLHERVTERDEVIDGLRADVVKLTESVDELRAELVDTRNEARHARDREAAALAKLEAADADSRAASQAQGQAEVVRDDALADRAELAAERSELARLAASAEALAQQLASLAAPRQSGAPKTVKRKALALPGGVMGDSVAAGEYLLRSGASVLIDGYNVAKLAWPNLDLEGQRVVLLDAIENLTRRFGSDITVVFDGSDVVGATADGRRIVRVMFSPAGVIADDVIRDEVRRLPATRSVVVVTNDRQIVRDVRTIGANTMTSDQLVTLLR